MVKGLNIQEGRAWGKAEEEEEGRRQPKNLCFYSSLSR
jgi:hypothetical protein